MNTVVVKKYVHIQDEKLASGTVSPGMLVKRTSADAVAAHSVAGGPVNALFALEDEQQGKGLTDDYATTTLVKLWRPVPGEQVNALLVASGNNVAIGDFLESAGNGKLRKCDAPLSSAGKSEFPASIVGVALTAGIPGTDTRIQVEIV